MKINKAYIFRLYPNNNQKELIAKSFGISRYIYNYFLNNSKDKYKNAYENIKSLKPLQEELPWLKEVDSCLLRTTLFDLDNSYQKFFKEYIGYPKLKSRNKSRKSYRTNNIRSNYKGKNYNSIEINLNNKTIKLPKLKEVKIKGYRNTKNINGRIINATIYKEANKYYVSVVFEEELFLPEVIHKSIIGLDLGIKTLVTTSDGVKINNKKYIEKYEKKIKGLNKWLSRTKRGSKTRKKVILKLQIAYKKLKNARKYFIHEITNNLVKENDIIVTETLNIKQMEQNKNLSKRITDASWGEIIRQLEYKTKWENKKLIKINTYYPSSQICNICNYKNENIKDLRIRKYICPECKAELDRDINASINIMFEGLKEYMKKIVIE